MTGETGDISQYLQIRLPQTPLAFPSSLVISGFISEFHSPSRLSPLKGGGDSQDEKWSEEKASTGLSTLGKRRGNT
jgi:hypothetical protein